MVVVLSANLLLQAAGSFAQRPGFIENRSYETLCAEVDNVDIPLWCPGIEAYRIVARHPRYNPTSINSWGPDWENCRGANEVTWLIGNIDGLSSEFADLSGTGDVHYAQDDPPAGIDEPFTNLPREINNDWMCEQEIRFTTELPDDSNAETKFGATLTVRMAAVASFPAQASPVIEIRASTRGAKGWIDHGSRVFTPAGLTGVWAIPDLTWVEGADSNVLRLAVVRAGGGSSTRTNCYAYYDYIELRRRPHKGSNNWTAPVLYDDGNIKIDAVWEDYWVNYPEEMHVDVVGGASIATSQYVRISQRLPGTAATNEIFVLYQNAYARIIPLAPANLSFVPYGASVIIAPTTNAARPNAHIDRVTIDPRDLSVDIAYQDGSAAHLELRADRDEHVVDVSGITYDTTNAAAVRLRSMWVHDGKADVDRLECERGTYSILDCWTAMTGTWWQFFREVPSYHNTYCPEFRMEILGSGLGRIVREAESLDAGSGWTPVSGRTNASGGRAVHMSSDGAEAVYRVALDRRSPATMIRIRYADADGGDWGDLRGKLLRVVLDSARTAEVYSVTTGGSNEFELTPSLDLGDLDAGAHQIRIETGAGAGGLDLDWFELVSQPVGAMARKSLWRQQGEVFWWGLGFNGVTEREGAAGGRTVHFEVTNAEPPFVVYSNTLVEGASPAWLRVRYSDDVGPNQVKVYVDDELRAHFPTKSTGGWDKFVDTGGVCIGPLTAGWHQVRFGSSSESWGWDLDEFEIYAVEPSE